MGTAWHSRSTGVRQVVARFSAGQRRVAPFHGPHSSRVVHAGGIPITTYCGHFGLAFPCYEIATQFHDEYARQVCLDIGGIILHQVARNGLGLAMHDDRSEFAIPDTCYFVAVPLMLAAVLDGERGRACCDQAVYQLRNYIHVFLAKETGLARTILLPTGLGRTYWTRASGWLLWAITGVLDHLPPDDPHFSRFLASLEMIASGLARVQDASGGLHLFLDDPRSPLETSGTAMCAMGLHQSVRRRWLPSSFQPVAARAWDFVRDNFTADGNLRNVYTGWAVPAEQRKVEMDRVSMGWIPGFALRAAHELSLS